MLDQPEFDLIGEYFSQLPRETTEAFLGLDVIYLVTDLPVQRRNMAIGRAKVTRVTRPEIRFGHMKRLGVRRRAIHEQEDCRT